MTEQINTADFRYEAGALKRTARTGWALAGIANRESVAGHSFRTALIARTLLAEIRATDPDDWWPRTVSG